MYYLKGSKHHMIFLKPTMNGLGSGDIVRPALMRVILIA